MRPLFKNNNIIFPFIFYSRLLLPSGWTRQPPGPLDRSRQRTEETKTVFQIPNTRARKRILVQCLCVQTETMGAGPKP